MDGSVFCVDDCKAGCVIGRMVIGPVDACRGREGGGFVSCSGLIVVDSSG